MRDAPSKFFKKLGTKLRKIRKKHKKAIKMTGRIGQFHPKNSNMIVPNCKRSLFLLNSLSEFVEAVLKDFDDQSLFSQFSVN